MRFFDTHLHLPQATRAGLDDLLRTLESHSGFMGGLLVLNTAQEVDLVYENLSLLPPDLVLIPYFEHNLVHPPEITKSGWYKIHPALQKLDIHSLSDLADNIKEIKPRGIMVHCFPWGPDLQFNVSLPFVIKLAQTLPESRILATHGGGYESWAFRAHAGAFRNVHFDFSMTLDYYENSDVLRPLQRYLKYSSNRVHFGSDWPSGGISKQLAEMKRLAQEIGISTVELESMLLDNARECWPEAVKSDMNR